MAGTVPGGQGLAGKHKRLSKAGEDYLECVYRITQETGSPEVRSVDVAERLDVSKASVNKAMATLKEDGYIEQTRYGKLRLTGDGADYGKYVWLTHRMLRSFLRNELGVEPERANDEACLMEHALSLDTLDRWLRYMEERGITIDE